MLITPRSERVKRTQKLWTHCQVCFKERSHLSCGDHGKKKSLSSQEKFNSSWPSELWSTSELQHNDVDYHIFIYCCSITTTPGVCYFMMVFFSFTSELTTTYVQLSYCATGWKHFSKAVVTVGIIMVAFHTHMFHIPVT